MELATKALATEDGQSAQTTQLQAISAAIGNIGLNNIGNIATLTTTDKTSLVGAVNEVNAGLATKADETELAAIESVYGSKNLFLNKGVTQTINGVTFTVNADKSVTVNGTAAGNTVLILNNNQIVKAGSYIASYVAPGGGQGYTFVGDPVDGSPRVFHCNNDTPAPFTLSSDAVLNIYFLIASGVTMNVTLYPMIRDARISDATYVPYAMTNRELTERVESSAWRDITSQCTFNTTNFSFYNQAVFDNGFAYLVTGLLTNIQSISDLTTLVTLPRNAIARSGQSGVTSGNFGSVEDVRIVIGISPNTNIVVISVGNWSATGNRNFLFSFLVPHA